MSAYNPPLENLDQFVTSNFEIKELTDGNTLTEANKLYVDSEIYTAGLNYLNLNTNQTIASGAIKTFTTSPIVPTPTTNFQASTKKYVDDEVSGINISNYLTLNSSQTIASGAVKTFTSSPILPQPTTDYQGATKKYVDDEIFDVDVTSFVSGNLNTENVFLGEGTGRNGSQTKSTAIGYNALITASNQVVLGTSNTNVYVPHRVGIGTNNPTNGLLHIYGNVAFSGSARKYLNNTITSWDNGNVSNEPVSIWASNNLVANAFYAVSDRRIKNNIVDVPDNLALQQVRDIPCRYYEYIDKISKRSEKVIGFIAQEVNEVLPTAVNTGTDYIPDVYRVLEGVSWEEIANTNGNVTYKMSSDLTDVSGVNYKFYVSNDLSDNEIEKQIIGNSDDTFTFDVSYQNVFCFGKEVDDFHSIDKDKIFALHHSAIQEIDKQQTADKIRIKTLEDKLADVLLRLDAAGI